MVEIILGDLQIIKDLVEFKEYTSKYWIVEFKFAAVIG